jgi:hypothetical protein
MSVCGGTIREMTITIPSGQPNNRFMRYVRPPVKDTEKLPALFPLQPATRPLRLAIDTTTVPVPPEGYLSKFFGRDEIDVQLLVPAGEETPAAWLAALHEPLVRQVGFTSIENAGRELDTAYFWIKTETEPEMSNTRAHFFDVFQHLDAQSASGNADPIAIEQRHHAAAYAAAAAALGIDAIVTNAPSAGRSDVADNDVVASVTPDEAVALIGHYLRMTHNPKVEIQRGRLVGGGIWERTESTATLANFYDWGVVSEMTYFDVFPNVAAREGDSHTVSALKSIRTRLARAARALDEMLAALSNRLDRNRRADVVEAAAEAFDRELLYLAAAFDIYGRRFPLLIDPARDPSRFRFSLDGRGYVNDNLAREYDATALADVTRLHVYAGVCKVLRNHIHDGILPVDHHPGRQYGNSMSVALNLDAMPELAPGAGNGMAQQHFDALGVWRADSSEVFGSPVLVADLATAGYTLMGAGLALIEAFTMLILRNKPQAAANPSRLLGCVQALPGETEPPLPERARFHSALFGWHPAQSR